MTNQQLDQLVERIGDQLLDRLEQAEPQLGVSPGSVLSRPEPSCGCEHRNDGGAPDVSQAALEPSQTEASSLRADASIADLEAVCGAARGADCAAVAVLPCEVSRAVRALRGSSLAVSCLVGYPHGSAVSRVKSAEAELALAHGAVEIELCLSAGALRSGVDDLIHAEIRTVAELVHAAGARLRVGTPTDLLDPHRCAAACALALLAGADVVTVRPSVGPASSDSVALFRRIVGHDADVHAAGGPDLTPADAAALLAAGADRVELGAVRFLPRRSAN